jgi:hypothetical protein
MIPPKGLLASAKTASLNRTVQKFVVSLPVISVGNDEKLLNLRERVFRNMGLSVQSMTPPQAGQIAHSSESRVWVFCNSIEPGELVPLANAVRKSSPNSRLLLLEGSRPVGNEASLFCCVFDCLGGIGSLLITLKELSTTH